jgi:hypothetical protein
MTSYPETLTVMKKLIKMGFFIIKIYYISSSNDPNITHTKNRIWGHSRTLTCKQLSYNHSQYNEKVRKLDADIIDVIIYVFVLVYAKNARLIVTCVLVFFRPTNQ